MKEIYLFLQNNESSCFCETLQIVLKRPYGLTRQYCSSCAVFSSSAVMEISQNEVGIFKLRAAELPNCGHRAASANTAHCGNPFCVVCALNTQRKATGSTFPYQERSLSMLVVVEGAFCEKPCPGLCAHPSTSAQYLQKLVDVVHEHSLGLQILAEGWHAACLPCCARGPGLA